MSLQHYLIWADSRQPRTVWWPTIAKALQDEINITGQRLFWTNRFSLPQNPKLQACYRGAGDQLALEGQSWGWWGCPAPWTLDRTCNASCPPSSGLSKRLMRKEILVNTGRCILPDRMHDLHIHFTLLYNNKKIKINVLIFPSFSAKRVLRLVASLSSISWLFLEINCVTSFNIVHSFSWT